MYLWNRPATGVDLRCTAIDSEYVDLVAPIKRMVDWFMNRIMIIMKASQVKKNRISDIFIFIRICRLLTLTSKYLQFILFQVTWMTIAVNQLKAEFSLETSFVYYCTERNIIAKDPIKWIEQILNVSRRHHWWWRTRSKLDRWLQPVACDTLPPPFYHARRQSARFKSCLTFYLM